MKTKAEIGIGDPVEVRFVVRPPSVLREHGLRTEDQDTRPAEEWRPGTVCSLSRDAIGIAFANGTRMEVPRHVNSWRPA